MPESLKTRCMRWYFNYLFPCYRRTGVRVLYFASDYHEVRIALPLNRRTRGYFGTLFGGSIYGVVDPVLMVMLNLILGRDYRVWDKEAHIRFLRAGRSTLYADFRLEEREIEAIRAELEHAPTLERVYHVALRDAEGVVHAEVDKTLHIRRRRPDTDAAPGGDSQ